MNQEERTVRFDHTLQVEAYRFEGIMQKFPNHFHEYYVIGFIEHGKRKLTCKNKDYIIGTGDVIFFNPFDTHACESINNETLDYRCLNINADIMKKVAEEITGQEFLPSFTSPVVYQCEHSSTLHKLHQMVMDERSDLEKEETFYFLLEQLIEAYSLPHEQMKKQKTPTQAVEHLCTYLKTHYSESIKLDDLAKIVKLNKYSLLRSFTRTLGITPYRYLQTIRINEAKKRLERGLKPIDAALDSGFIDQSHFSHFFKEFIGLTPGQYQKIFDKS
ncbi:AraC family transcriptional regulator [Rossellomorea marisflavi]|uniref:AraC family transcriptional regulator n=1 Tax=Rossellomorea marisflavi TaxID=189381 RepID=UPI00203C7A6B|nr:AraC family transcriptional regulator [Rossellomorea marisflavi]MCM2588255.1 AraC family transcriptional regulator [Rossellomorea marisflavi]